MGEKTVQELAAESVERGKKIMGTDATTDRAASLDAFSKGNYLEAAKDMLQTGVEAAAHMYSHPVDSARFLVEHMEGNAKLMISSPTKAAAVTKESFKIR